MRGAGQGVGYSRGSWGRRASCAWRRSQEAGQQQQQPLWVGKAAKGKAGGGGGGGEGACPPRLCPMSDDGCRNASQGTTLLAARGT